jgi:hypothetical protein
MLTATLLVALAMTSATDLVPTPIAEGLDAILEAEQAPTSSNGVGAPLLLVEDGAAPAPDSNDKRTTGISPFPMLALQCGVACISWPVFAAVGAGIPVIGWLAAPLATAALVTWMGDLFGQQRGPLLWPMLGAVGAECVGIGCLAVSYPLLIIAGFAGIFGGFAFGLPPEIAVALLPVAPLLAVVLLGAAAVVIALAVPLTPALIYFLTSEDKRPGDDGGGFPGIVTPGHKEESVQRLLFRPRSFGGEPSMAF